jgi:hypothetical protein
MKSVLHEFKVHRVPGHLLDLKTDCYFGESQVELIERAGGFTDQETRLMVNQGIGMGRGGIFLRLTEEQYATLRKR